MTGGVSGTLQSLKSALHSSGNGRKYIVSTGYLLKTQFEQQKIPLACSELKVKNVCPLPEYATESFRPPPSRCISPQNQKLKVAKTPKKLAKYKCPAHPTCTSNEWSIRSLFPVCQIGAPFLEKSCWIFFWSYFCPKSREIVICRLFIIFMCQK